MEREEYLNIKANTKKEYDMFLDRQTAEISNLPVFEKKIVENMLFFKVIGVDTVNDQNSFISFLCSMYSLNFPIAFIVKIVDGKLNIFFGTDMERIGTLEKFVVQQFSANVESDRYAEKDMFEKQYCYSTLLIGDCSSKEEKAVSVLDKIMMNPRGLNASVIIVTTPMPNSDVKSYCDRYSDMITALEQLTSRQTSIRDERESVSFNDSDSKLLRFKSLMEEQVEKYKLGIKQGMFSCTVKIYADSYEDLNLISGAYLSELKNEDMPRTLSAYYVPNGLKYNAEAIVTLTETYLNNKLIRFPVYSNIYTPSEAARLICFPSNDVVGFFKREIPEFDVNRECSGGLYVGNILCKKTEVNKYFVPESDLNRHIFVPGMTGSGKTNTIKCLLYEMKEIPWLVVEPAKAEYYEMFKMGIDDLKIISTESGFQSLKINPFEPVNSKVTLQEHIDSLYAALLASFSWTPPMPYVLEVAINRLYEEFGFDLLDESKNYGRRYPNIEALFYLIPTVVEEMNYDGRMKMDIIASIQARLSTLRRGSKGSILNIDKSINFEEIFSGHVIIELENIKDNDTKAFIMSLICILLREYRMQQDDSQLEIKHFFLLEEAHRILKNCGSNMGEVANSRANGVEFFSDMLAELRAKGQGFILADQIPENLTVSVIRNTNLKIVHRLVSKVDAQLLGDAMRCEDAQIAYIPTLNRGEALVFSEGDYRAKLVKIPNSKKYILEERETLNRKNIMELCNYHKCNYRDTLMSKSAIEVVFGEHSHDENLPDEILESISTICNRRINSKDEFVGMAIEIFALLKYEAYEEIFWKVLEEYFKNEKMPIQQQYDCIWALIENWDI